MALKTGVVYLQKDKLQLYSPLLGNVLELRFGPDFIRDLDIINIEVLENKIKAFVTAGKIAPCNLIFVLADNAYFIKDFVPPAQTKSSAMSAEVSKQIIQKQADEFIEHVPFDNVVNKIIPITNGIRVCATNKDFYETIAVSFEQLGFSVSSVLPGLIINPTLSSRPVLDNMMVNAVLQKISTVKAYDMLNQQVYQPVVKQETEEVDEVEQERLQTKKPPNKMRLFALVGVFAVLLILLVVVYMQSQAAPPPNKPAATPQAAAPVAPVVNQPTVTVTTSPTAQLVASTSALQTNGLSVQIVNTQSNTTSAETLREKMNLYKFKSVSVQSQSSIGSSTTVVSFSNTVSQAVRNTVLDEVKQLRTNVTVQEKENSISDITIILGQ
ncbi:MAG: hypothetical protein ACREHC_01615 [Candidatus Levyibacteriota bacterium]